MSYERMICCWTASSWSKVVAWFQIVGNFILLIIFALAIAAMKNYKLGEIVQDDELTTLLYVTVSIELAVSAFGFIMGVFLLIGTNQKRIGLLHAWQIYAVISIVFLCLTFIANIFDGNRTTYDRNSYPNSRPNNNTAMSLVGDIVGITLRIFCFVVVHIHIKDIREGVFAQRYQNAPIRPV